MAKGRWYPTVTELADGRLVTVAGKDTTNGVVLIPKVWDGTRWCSSPARASSFLTTLVTSSRPTAGYSCPATARRDSLTWTGRAGAGAAMDHLTAHIWTFNSEYGSAVMYEAGKILYVGGGGDPTWIRRARTADDSGDRREDGPDAGISDLAVRRTLPTPRRHLNATVLPDGQVLVTGGRAAGA